MKNLLEISPKETGSTIKFGKLPIFTRSLTALADMDNVVQIVVEGRYYAAEIRGEGKKKSKKSKQSKQAFSDKSFAEVVETLARERNDFVKVEHKSEKTVAPKQKLEDIGFVSLKTSEPQQKTVVAPKKKTLARGDQSLFDWLSVDDFVIYTLLVRDNGNPRMDKSIEFDDICLAFLDAGVPDKKAVGGGKGQSAQRLANVAIALLTRKGVLQKEEDPTFGNVRYRLTVTKGGKYARAVYSTVSRGRYSVDPATNRRAIVC